MPVEDMVCGDALKPVFIIRPVHYPAHSTVLPDAPGRGAWGRRMFSARRKSMNIIDMFSITELSRLTGKSRPSLYKYIAAYERGDEDEVPALMRELFQMIKSNVAKTKIIAYCEEYFAVSAKKEATDDELFRFLKENRGRIDLESLKKYIEEETKK